VVLLLVLHFRSCSHHWAEVMNV